MTGFSLTTVVKQRGRGSMEDVLAVRDEYRLQSWAEIIRERRASGLTNKKFCAERGIPEKRYYLDRRCRHLQPNRQSGAQEY